MSYRVLSCLLIALAMGTLVPGGATAQGGSSEAGPRTAWGAPDLQGVWDFRSLTPMERPEDLAESELFTAEQAALFADETIRRRSRDNDTSDRVLRETNFMRGSTSTVSTTSSRAPWWGRIKRGRSYRPLPVMS